MLRLVNLQNGMVLQKLKVPGFDSDFRHDIEEDMPCACAYIYIFILVGGLEHVFHILGIIIPTDFQLTFIFFRGVETTNQYIYICVCVSHHLTCVIF